jgi:hypothetical protein
MQCRLSLLLLLCLAVSLPTAVLAHKEPVPAELLQAKTVYIKSYSASDVRQCSEELSKWGRFKIVADPKDADVIFYIGSHTASNGSYTRTGNVMTANSSLLITVEVVQASSQKPLWSSTQSWSPFRRTPTKNIVKELRKRVEEREKTQ